MKNLINSVFKYILNNLDQPVYCTMKSLENPREKKYIFSKSEIKNCIQVEATGNNLFSIKKRSFKDFLKSITEEFCIVNMELRIRSNIDESKKWLGI